MLHFEGATILTVTRELNISILSLGCQHIGDTLVMVRVLVNT